MSNGSVSISTSDLLVLLEATGLSLNQKIYSKENAEKIFKVWNNLTTDIERLKRNAVFNQLYPPISKDTPNETKVSLNDPPQ